MGQVGKWEGSCLPLVCCCLRQCRAQIDSRTMEGSATRTIEQLRMAADSCCCWLGATELKIAADSTDLVLAATWRTVPICHARLCREASGPWWRRLWCAAAYRDVSVRVGGSLGELGRGGGRASQGHAPVPIGGKHFLISGRTKRPRAAEVSLERVAASFWPRTCSWLTTNDAITCAAAASSSRVLFKRTLCSAAEPNKLIVWQTGEARKQFGRPIPKRRSCVRVCKSHSSAPTGTRQRRSSREETRASREKVNEEKITLPSSCSSSAAQEMGGRGHWTGMRRRRREK